MARSMARSSNTTMIGMKMEENNRDDDISNYNNDDDQAK